MLTNRQRQLWVRFVAVTRRVSKSAETFHLQDPMEKIHAMPPACGIALPVEDGWSQIFQTHAGHTIGCAKRAVRPLRHELPVDRFDRVPLRGARLARSLLHFAVVAQSHFRGGGRHR